MEKVSLNRKFWDKRKVLVTGYEGFLGSNLTKALLSCGSKVFGVDIKTERKDMIFSSDEYSKIVRVRADVADFKVMHKLISRHRINVIFHLAAEALVEGCNKDPRRAFLSNICGSWNILEAARKNSCVKAIVLASSDKAYGSHKKLPYKENAALRGDHPYDASKSCADLIANTYYHTYGLPVAVTRCGNIFGPGDFNFSRILPDAIRCAFSGKTLYIRSDGKFTRDYIYVKDIVNGYLLLAEKLLGQKLLGEAFNFSYENPLSVTELLRLLYEVIGGKPDYKILNQAKYEIRHQYLSSAKARKLLGWKPRYSLRQGLAETAVWYKGYFSL
ncbi:MAG: GDP-mannose 4,6-dehydratase [Candidatus Omnitrophica bacterium]|nr:GDP-mannose 4,6-dehydratase [Candidatus Omnitrophota bacterium]